MSQESKSIFDSIFDTIKDRLSSPFFGSFTISWLILHWDFIAFLIWSDASASRRIELAASDYLDIKWTLVSLWVALFYVVVYPYIDDYLGKLREPALKRARTRERENLTDDALHKMEVLNLDEARAVAERKAEIDRESDRYAIELGNLAEANRKKRETLDKDFELFRTGIRDKETALEKDFKERKSNLDEKISIKEETLRELKTSEHEWTELVSDQERKMQILEKDQASKQSKIDSNLKAISQQQASLQAGNRELIKLREEIQTLKAQRGDLMRSDLAPLTRTIGESKAMDSEISGESEVPPEIMKHFSQLPEVDRAMLNELRESKLGDRTFSALVRDSSASKSFRFLVTNHCVPVEVVEGWYWNDVPLELVGKFIQEKVTYQEVAYAIHTGKNLHDLWEQFNTFGYGSVKQHFSEEKIKRGKSNQDSF